MRASLANVYIRAVHLQHAWMRGQVSACAWCMCLHVRRCTHMWCACMHTYMRVYACMCACTRRSLASKSAIVMPRQILGPACVRCVHVHVCTCVCAVAVAVAVAVDLEDGEVPLRRHLKRDPAFGPCHIGILVPAQMWSELCAPRGWLATAPSTRRADLVPWSCKYGERVAK